ncbi:MAG: mannose-1-phosphate guanylyltransferase/mannose-6-phosphate isomerase [Alphaproteobacteria bacterium]|nr:mannose-1-phosphate guanylyltransferase/mannose-6-phosphate isomerase [Alphaproteobacteria bacterium]
MTTRPTIHPVILSGGAGTRLWPLSREQYPKQLLPLASERSMIQDTVARVGGPGFARPIVVCNNDHRFIIAEQLRELDVTPAAILLEPVARNTTAAVAAAAAHLAAHDPGGLLLVLPSDHVIQDREAFLAATMRAADAAAVGRLVTFGITPTGPETGYGYIRQGAPLDGHPGTFVVERFVEKPDLKTAQGYLAAGGWSWNSGMFMLPITGFRAELARHAGAVAEAVDAAVARSRTDLDFVRLDAESFARAPSISIDYAVMEKTDRAAVVPAKLGWSDVGAWSALWEIGARDTDGNVTLGDVQVEGTRNSYLRAEHGLLAAIGVEDMVIVALKDAVLVARRDEVQNVKTIVDRLKKAGRTEATAQPRIYRPWGSYETIDAGRRFQVKRLIVNPGQRLSLQKHAQRAEHWVVVQGAARVTRDEDILTLRENMSIDIPVGCVHRLENPGVEPLHLIEVQSGGYLGEDDIVRLEDSYGRE